MDNIDDLIETHFRQDYPRLVNLVSKIIDYDETSAEDVVQNAYTKALAYKESFSKFKGSFNKWFIAILFNCVFDHRMSGRATPVSEEELEQIQFEFYSRDFTNNSVVRSLIHEYKRSDHKKILESFYIKGYTSKEIHHTLGYSPTKIRKVCSEFRKQVKKSVEDV